MAPDRCGYRHDVSSYTDIPGEEWECPREAQQNGQCLFHLDPSEKSNQKVVDTLIQLIQASHDRTSPESKRFFGAEFDDLDLRGVRFFSDDAEPVDLRDARVDGRLDWSRLHSDLPVKLDGLQVGGPAIFDNAHFSKELSLTDARFEDDVSFFDASFQKDARFTRTEFHEIASFYAAAFDADARFTDCRFGSHAKFSHSQIQGNAQFGRSIFSKRIRFRGANFEGDTWFDDSIFVGITTFTKSSFHGEVRFDGLRFHELVQFAHTEFEDEANFIGIETYSDISFEDARFDRDITLTGHLESSISFNSARVGSQLKIRDLEVYETQEIDLREAQIPTGKLEQPHDGAVTYDLSNATIGDVEIGTSDSNDTAFHRYRFEQTSFDGFDFSNYTADLSKNRWIIHTISETQSQSRRDKWIPSMFDRTVSMVNFDTASERARACATHEGTYLRAKNGASAVGADHAAAEFFIRELSFRRRKHFWHAVDIGTPPGSLQSALKWIANLGLGVTSGYGERPSYVLAFSFVLILAFGGIFNLVSPTLYETSQAYFALSSGSFVALLFGNPGPIQNFPLVSTLAHIEAIMGAFLIALFVFTLTRSIHR